MKKLNKVFDKLKARGNFGHAGRPGKRGGSAPRSGGGGGIINSNIVADRLHDTGFRTKVITSNAVQVGLTNRKVSTMEVKTTLNKLFDEKFDVKSVRDEVLVSW